MTDFPFADRTAAGQVLAERLADYRDRAAVVVLGLPRGGVPVAAEVARFLAAPLDVVVVRKIGVPQHPELAMGALAGVAGTIETVHNEEVLAQMRRLDWDGETFERVAARERDELLRREDVYRARRPPLKVTGEVVVLVDDGLATGATMRAAVAAVRKLGPAELVVAVPVGSAEVCAHMRDVADDVVCAWLPEPPLPVGAAYLDFDQTTDEEVRRLLGVTPSR